MTWTLTRGTSLAVGGGQPVRVVIADDHDLYRRGMQVVVELDGTATVVGEASNGEEAVEAVLRLNPEVVLMDVRMPGVGGIEACRRIRVAAPEARILMLTMSDDESDLFEAIKAGASGYLLKDLPGEEVADAIRRVHDGQAIIPPGMAATLLSEFTRLSQTPVPAEGGTPPPQLTDREVEVLRLVARGHGQPGDRREARHLREHREEPRPQHPREAAPPLPRRGGRVRPSPAPAADG